MEQSQVQKIEKGIDGLIILTMHIKSVRSAAVWST